MNSQCTLIPCTAHLAVCFTATSTDSSGRSLLVAPYVMWGSSSPLSARRDEMRRASKSSTMFIAAAVRRNALRVSGRCRQGPRILKVWAVMLAFCLFSKQAYLFASIKHGYMMGNRHVSYSQA